MSHFFMKSEDKSNYLHWSSSWEKTWIFIAKLIAGNQRDSHPISDSFRYPHYFTLFIKLCTIKFEGWIALPEATASTVQHNLLLILQWSRAMHSRCFCRCLSLPWNEVGRPSCTFQFYHLQGHTWSYNTLFPL